MSDGAAQLRLYRVFLYGAGKQAEHFLGSGKVRVYMVGLVRVRHIKRAACQKAPIQQHLREQRTHGLTVGNIETEGAQGRYAADLNAQVVRVCRLLPAFLYAISGWARM